MGGLLPDTLRASPAGRGMLAPAPLLVLLLVRLESIAPKLLKFRAAFPAFVSRLDEGAATASCWEELSLDVALLFAGGSWVDKNEDDGNVELSALSVLDLTSDAPMVGAASREDGLEKDALAGTELVIDGPAMMMVWSARGA